MSSGGFFAWQGQAAIIYSRGFTFELECRYEWFSF
jgi:hypothetical protein